MKRQRRTTRGEPQSVNLPNVAYRTANMGQKADQNAFTSTYRPDTDADAAPPALPAGAPPLPPRNPSLSTPPEIDAPPAYSEAAPSYHAQPITASWTAQDPRSSSTQSLVPRNQSEEDDKRRLLLIWIHGFMGNETSFQSFPAHVHNVLSPRLQDAGKGTHVVHTKIYPRYKSRNKIEVARDAFSAWLAPHEDINTDVILLGHSLGGVLSAEVVLKPASSSEPKQYHHRILGTINFDTPFLGMHPSVVSSGLGSLFRPASTPPTPNTTSRASEAGSARPEALALPAAVDTTDSRPDLNADSVQSFVRPTETLTATTSTSTLPCSSLNLPIDDANYDPPYPNDVHLPQRSGRSNLWHFLNKHADGTTLVSKSKALSRAARSLVTSHLEFGGCLADYYGLRVRYKHLKALDQEKGEKRVRFVNYYTASTGRPRKVRPPHENTVESQMGHWDGQEASVEQDLEDVHLQPTEENAVPLRQSDSAGNIASEQGVVKSDSLDDQHLFARSASLDDEGATSGVSSLACVSPAPVDGSQEEPESVIKAPEPAGEVSNPDDSPITLGDPHSDQILAAGGELSPQASQPAIALPPIPALPDVPPLFDPTSYTDKDTRKLAEKEHSRSVKRYEHLVKDRDRAIKDRRKLLEKREAAVKKEQEKRTSAQEKEKAKVEADVSKKAEKEKAKAAKKHQAIAEKERLAEEKERQKVEARRLDRGVTDPVPLSQATTETSSAEAQEDQNDRDADSRPPKDRKFCVLPSLVDGKPDPCWIRVFMPGVDEVGAHCGLFTVDGERYEWFVGDVADRIEAWIAEGRK